MIRLVFAATLLYLTAAEQWSDTLPDQAVVTTCSGSDIHLPWNFTLSSGQQVEDIKWVYQASGRAEEVIAVYAAGNFLVMPAFSGRVRRIGEGGIVISNAGLLESGNYSVAISVFDTANTFDKQQRMAKVQVADYPKTESIGLHVQQTTGAVYDNATRQWHVQLTCGVFSYLGDPAVQVVWTTPDSQQLQSSSFFNGTFNLLVPNPPSGGNYTCTLPPLSPATHCLPPLSPLREGATVAVDGVKASFALLAAKQGEIQTQMKAENDRLRVDLESLKKENQEMKKESETEHSLLKGEVTLLKSENNRLEASVESLREENERTKNESSMDNNLLKVELALLKSKLDNATAEEVSFHARLSGDTHMNSSETLKPWSSITNQGQSFNAATGVFVAPVPGFFFFVASTIPPGSTWYTDMEMLKDGQVVSGTSMLRSSSWGVGSCHAVVHLAKGQQVWLQDKSGGFYGGDRTFFSGFLINARA